ncbi:DUF397 domain-containing protein [Nocardia blacklockiae]|uniref:DUF397 domain-containing protein n=1 Tax=Nocardia blacklockiae TaxID=480036 RepID=UPI001894E52E|nr:DUF397 domain-containing protein [Nocardia blacklockiae]MBF6176020.1 DUF397 domain-containing protein [Nocardia blacklockiae]
MGTTWFKSTFSGSEKTCVEVAHRDDTVHVRDSKYTGDPAQQPIVSIRPADWQPFLDLALSGNSGALTGGIAITNHHDGGATITGPHAALVYDAAEWDAFTKGIADGQFDRRG